MSAKGVVDSKQSNTATLCPLLLTLLGGTFQPSTSSSRPLALFSHSVTSTTWKPRTVASAARNCCRVRGLFWKWW